MGDNFQEPIEQDRSNFQIDEAIGPYNGNCGFLVGQIERQRVNNACRCEQQRLLWNGSDAPLNLLWEGDDFPDAFLAAMVVKSGDWSSAGNSEMSFKIVDVSPTRGLELTASIFPAVFPGL